MIRLLSALLFTTALTAAEPRLETSEVFPVGMNVVARYRIPGIVVTQKGTVLACCEARKNSSSDWGEIEVHLRRSTDGGLGSPPSTSPIAPIASKASCTEKRRARMSKPSTIPSLSLIATPVPSSFSTASTTPAASPCAAPTMV